MKTRNTLAAAGLAALLASALQPAIASTTVYDSITGHGYGNAGLSGGYLEDADTRYLTAQRFTPDVDGYIDALTLSAWGQSGIVIDLYSDEHGQLGQSLQAMTLQASTDYGSYASGIFAGGAQLTAGSDYWIVLGAHRVYVNWSYMDGGDGPGTDALAFGLAPGFDVPTAISYYTPTPGLGMRISVFDGSTVPSVPEPSSWALMAAGALALALSRRRPARRR